jgi:hypothetical protein
VVAAAVAVNLAAWVAPAVATNDIQPPCCFPMQSSQQSETFGLFSSRILSFVLACGSSSACSLVLQFNTKRTKENVGPAGINAICPYDVYKKGKRPDDAITELNKAASARPRDREIHRLLAEVYRAKGELAQAGKEYLPLGALAGVFMAAGMFHSAASRPFPTIQLSAAPQDGQIQAEQAAHT